MDQDPTITNTPRSNARRNERNARTLDSPERRRTPQVPRLAPPVQPFQLPAFPPPQIGPTQSNDPFQNNYAPPATIPPQNAYHHLPAHLAQAVAQLPPLQPVRRRGRRQRRQIDPEVIILNLHRFSLLTLFCSLYLPLCLLFQIYKWCGSDLFIIAKYEINIWKIIACGPCSSRAYESRPSCS
jgi:hypothetical protein